MAEETVTKKEYDQHKRNCGESFDAILLQISKLDRAVYGDKDIESIGMAAQVKEMHAFFFSTNVIIRVVKNGFLVLAFVSGLIYGFVKIWKEFK